jgi:ubiquitin-like 1-activating enzyme E1 A
MHLPAVCADFERQKGRFPGPGDLGFLAQQARILAAEARADAAVDGAKSGAPPPPPPRDLVTEDVMPEEALAEFVLGVAELPPVNAVLGGVLANEMLKAVSHKGEPINNFFFFSLADNVGLVETLGDA